MKVDSLAAPMVEISCRVIGNATQCFRDSSVYEIRDLRTKLMVTAPGLWATHTASYHYDSHMLLDTLTSFTGEKETITYTGELLDSTGRSSRSTISKLTYNHTQWLHTMSRFSSAIPR